VFVKRGPKDIHKRLLTDDQAREVEHQWDETALEQDVQEKLRELGIGAPDRAELNAELKKRFGRAPGPRDVLWAAWNFKLLTAIAENNWELMATIYIEQAHVLHEERKSHREVLAQYHRARLRALQAEFAGVGKPLTSVRVITATGQACSECQKLEGRVLPLAEALQSGPLPVLSCTTWIHLGNKHGGFCRCFYQPVVPEWDEG